MCDVVFDVLAWFDSVGIALAFFAGQQSSALVTRFGCRVTTLIGGTFCVVSLIASSFVENMMVLFFTYSLLLVWDPVARSLRVWWQWESTLKRDGHQPQGY